MTIEYFYNEKQYKISEICDVLNVNRSSYYKWKRAKKSSKELRDEELAALILEYHETFVDYFYVVEIDLYGEDLNYSFKELLNQMIIYKK